MLFDTDKYLDTIQAQKEVPELEMPNTKVAAINLPKLGYEKKLANIHIDVRVTKDLLIRDYFDWDLNDYK